jgi:xanthine dehydrogenase FAD-binding subunit
MTELKHYFAPTSLDQAVECLKGGNVTILAGGTDLTPQSQAGRIKFRQTLMNIRHIPQLTGITLEGNEIRIGALATITEIMEHPLVRQHLPVLIEACDHFRQRPDPQRRHHWRQHLQCLAGRRHAGAAAGARRLRRAGLDAGSKLYRHCMPISTFFTGPGKTRKSLCELVTGVRIPVPGAHHVSRFYKHGTRPALDISTISIGFAADRHDGVLKNVRVAFGAVAPTPLRATATESALEGRHLDAATIEAAAIAARDEVNPIDDVRATAWYRKEMIHNMTKRMLENVAQA